MVKFSSSAFAGFNRRRWWLAAAGLALLGLAYWALRPAGASRGGEHRPGRWNVVLVTIDTLRADHVSAYGKGRADTPAIDALASEGVLFEHCVAQAPLTLPSHASLLAATQPLFHRVRDNGAFQAPPELELLSEVLHARGFATAAFIGGYVLHGKWGLNQGFDLYSDRFDPGSESTLVLQAKKPAATVLADARGWLQENGDRRFFAWIHLYDPHFPYEPPPPFDRRGSDPYRGEVEYADHELGGFISYLREKGWYDRTLVVVASDHGEGLNDHGEQKHGYFLYETTIHVPLIMRAPIPFAAKNVPQTVQLVDVAPTILDLLEIPAPAGWQGKTMRRLMAGKADERFGSAYCETWYPRLHYGWSPLKAFYNDRQKYIYSPRDELYDLERDPGEQRNLAGERPRQRSDLRGRGLAFMQAAGRGALTPGSIAVMNAEDRRRLAALGYLGGSMAPADDGSPLADPKDKLPDYIAFGKAFALLGDGRWQEALDAARGIVGRNPGFADAVNLEGNALLAGGRYAEALDAFRRGLALKPEDPNYRLDLLKTLEKMGKLEDAASAALRFLRDAPSDATLIAALGRIRLEQKRDEEGLQALQQALAADPGIYPRLNQAAEILIARQAFSGARQLLLGVLAATPRAAGSHYLLGQIAEGEGNAGAAMDFYRRELEIDAKRFEAAVNLANLLKQGGQLAEAARYYRMAIVANDKLKMPRFHLAEIMLRGGRDLDQAVALCLAGIELPPQDRDTLFGYFVLTNLYAALGNGERRDFYTRAGEKLIARLEKH